MDVMDKRKAHREEERESDRERNTKAVGEKEKGTK